MDKMRRWVRNQRGSILLFTVVLVTPLMIIIGGLAMDLAYLGTVDDELQRSMDAAALAGAGNLSFDPSAFTGDSSPVRVAAQNYATSNPYRAENLAKQITTTTFKLNAANVDNLVDGNIVVGIWNGTTSTIGSYPPGFTRRSSSTDDPFVNAVKCQFANSIPTSFLKLIGLTGLSTAAQAIAVAGPPATLCPGCCPFPVGVTKCPFQDAGGNFGSQGCGQPVSTFIPSTTNTASWINISGTSTPNAPDTKDAITAAATGAGCNSTLSAGSQVGANNGMIESVFKTLADCSAHNCDSGPGTNGYFIDKYNSPTILTVKDANENITYQGHGWEVFVPVIDTADHSCPPGPMNGSGGNAPTILTFSRLVITQVIDHGYCAVANHHPGTLWDANCPTPNGTASTRVDPDLRAIFGYFSCATWDAPPVPNPAPIAGLAEKLRLVK